MKPNKHPRTKILKVLASTHALAVEIAARRRQTIMVTLDEILKAELQLEKEDQRIRERDPEAD